MADLKIGVIGCGGIGSVHISRWAKIEGATIVAACDVDEAKAAGVEGARPYSDFTAMLENEQLDAVDICTPPGLHAPPAVAALRRGIPVMCEKPLARTPDEAREIVDAAEASGTPLLTGFCHRFHEPIEIAANLIRSGELGRVLMFRNRFATRFAGVEDRWFSKRDIAGGGALMDTSIHSVDLFRHLVGEVATARAALATFSPKIQDVEDSAALTVVAPTGAIGVIECSWATPYSINDLEVYGESGAVIVDYDRGEVRYRTDNSGEWVTPEHKGQDRFEEELRHFTAVVRGEAEPRVTGRDGLRALEVLYEAYAAAQ